MIQNILNLRKIDRIVRLYLLMVILNAAIHFNPLADSDFSPLYNWMNSFYSVTEYDQELYNTLFSSVPISQGNVVYLLTLFVGELLFILGAYIYASVYVRDYRIEKAKAAAENGQDAINYAVTSIPDEPIKPSRLVKRLLLLMLMTTVLFLPVLTISLNFMFLAIIGLPFVFTAPVAYLAGDKGLFTSLPYVCKLSSKYYFLNMRSIALVLFVILAMDFLVPLISKVSLTAYYIVDSAVTAWLWLSIARLAALAYCSMKDFPIKGSKRPFAI